MLYFILYFLYHTIYYISMSFKSQKVSNKHEFMTQVLIFELNTCVYFGFACALFGMRPQRLMTYALQKFLHFLLLHPPSTILNPNSSLRGPYPHLEEID